jgi:hypothetical protein
MAHKNYNKSSGPYSFLGRHLTLEIHLPKDLGIDSRIRLAVSNEMPSVFSFIYKIATLSCKDLNKLACYKLFL